MVNILGHYDENVILTYIWPLKSSSYLPRLKSTINWRLSTLLGRSGGIQLRLDTFTTSLVSKMSSVGGQEEVVIWAIYVF